MSSNVKIRPEQLAKTMKQVVEKYGDEAYEISQQAAKSTARQATTQLKGSAPSGGSYARGWSHKAQKDGYSKYTEVVYNRTDYQLTHLLEKPHPTGPKGGGHYPNKANYTGTIAKVEQIQSDAFFQEVKSKL